MASARTAGLVVALVALVSAAQPREFVPAPEDPGRQVRAAVGLVNVLAGYAASLVMDVALVVDLVSACSKEPMVSAGCIAAPASAIGLGTLSLVPVVGPAVIGWAADTGVGPSLKAQPTAGYRVAGFIAAAAQLVGLLLLFSALDGAPSGVAAAVTVVPGGMMGAIQARW